MPLFEKEIKEKSILHWNYLFHFHSLPQQLFSMGHNVTEIYLRGNKLSYLPEEIGLLMQLKELFLGDNNLKSLPNSMSCLHNLSLLELSRNQFHGNLPPQLVGLKQSLKSLDLSSNQFTSFSDLGNLENLENLFLSSNHLKELPQSCLQLKYLQNLVAENNEIATIPKEIYKLQNLKYLDLSRNKLESLPNTITLLPRLKLLKVNQNQLKRLPNLPFLNCTTVNCSQNPSMSHLPYILTLDKEIFGEAVILRQCFALESCEFNPSLDHPGSSIPFTFQNDCCCTKFKVLSLRERLLRYLKPKLHYDNIAKSFIKDVEAIIFPEDFVDAFLPQSLWQEVKFGMNAFCSYLPCGNYVFQHFLTSFFKLNVTDMKTTSLAPVSRPLLIELAFCSHKCLESFILTTNTKLLSAT